MKTSSPILLAGLLFGPTVAGFMTMPSMETRTVTQPFLGVFDPPPFRPRAVRLRTALSMSTPEPSFSDAASTQQGDSLSQETLSTNPFAGDFLDNFRKMDVDEVINSLAIVGVLVGVGVLLYQIDASLPHTGVDSLKDLATRIPLEAFHTYEGFISVSPIATKAATSATVYTIGDVVAQRAEGISMGGLDRPRILRSLLAGLIGHGPLSHFWYTYLDQFFNNVLHLTEWWSFVPKVILDQTTWGPFWNNSYILLIGLMKLDSFENIWSDMKRSTIPLIVSGLKLWPLAHCITYGLVPMENRVLWVDMVEILWVTILATQAAAASVERESQATQQLEAPMK